MCIRDRLNGTRAIDNDPANPLLHKPCQDENVVGHEHCMICLLYTSDAADDLLCVDLGGRRIIKKKNLKNNTTSTSIDTQDMASNDKLRPM